MSFPPTSRKLLAPLVAVCLALAGLAAACGGKRELNEPVTITVWSWTPGTAEAVAMFEKAHPNINVNLHNVGQGPPHYRKVRTVLRAGRGLPDVIQMEFQYIPSFTLTKSLLDLEPYLPDDFLSGYPEWIAKQVDVDGGIYGVPWDTGPLGFIYRRDLLREAGIRTPIRTWDAFADAAVRYHRANPKSYLVNMPGGETGQWLALFWQNGARPFTTDPRDFKADLTDPKVTQVTEYWDRLYRSGAVSHDPDFTDAWFQGFARGKYAGWISAAWGPVVLQDYTKRSKGQWHAQALPTWREGERASGNWGGSTLAVLKQSKHPAAAAEFARWVLTERRPVEMFMFERFLFPAQSFMLHNRAWLTKKYAFYGGQEVNQVFAGMANAVDTDWQWAPIHEYVATQGDDIRAKFVRQGKGLTASLRPWQDAVLNYAEEQGLSVAGR